jgi:L-glyceraldehyde 3-phosphate reductase
MRESYASAANAGSTRTARRIDLTAEELAEIDQFAREAGINIWAASSQV